MQIQTEKYKINKDETKAFLLKEIDKFHQDVKSTKTKEAFIKDKRQFKKELEQIAKCWSYDTGSEDQATAIKNRFFDMLDKAEDPYKFYNKITLYRLESGFIPSSNRFKIVTEMIKIFEKFKPNK